MSSVNNLPKNIYETFEYEFTKSFLISAESTFKSLEGPSKARRASEVGLSVSSGVLGLLLGPPARILALILKQLLRLLDEYRQNDKKNSITEALNSSTGSESLALQQIFQKIFVENGVETFYYYNLDLEAEGPGDVIFAQQQSGWDGNPKGSHRKAIQILGAYAGACCLKYLAIISDKSDEEIAKTGNKQLWKCLAIESTFPKFKSWLKSWTQEKLYVIVKNKKGEEHKKFVSAYTYFLKKSLSLQINSNPDSEKSDSKNLTIKDSDYKIRDNFTSTSNPANITESIYKALLNDSSYTLKSNGQFWVKLQAQKEELGKLNEYTQAYDVVDHEEVDSALRAVDEVLFEEFNADEATKLKELFGKNPLALKLAVAIMDCESSNTDIAYGVQDFINEFSRLQNLEKNAFEEPLLITTVKLSLEKIKGYENTGELALQILNSTAYLSESIPKELLCGLFQETPSSQPRNELVADAIILLLNYNLIDLANNDSTMDTFTFTAHSKIQRIIRDELEDNDTAVTPYRNNEEATLLELTNRFQDFLSPFLKSAAPTDHKTSAFGDVILNLVCVADHIINGNLIFRTGFPEFFQFVATVLEKEGRSEGALKYTEYVKAMTVTL